MLSAFVADIFAASDTCTVKFVVPAPVGVPVIAPVEELSVKPLGRAPTEIDQVNGAVPPPPARVWLYAAPAVAFGREAVVTEGRAFTVMESVAVFDVSATEVAVIVAVIGLVTLAGVS